MLLLIVWFVGAFSVAGAQNLEWNALSYPNLADYQRCNVDSYSNICDPDVVLSKNEINRLNYELNQLDSLTRQPNADNFCSKKGITGAIALARHVRGGSDNDIKVMANDLLRRWKLDEQCGKSLVIVIATEDKKFWVARDNRVPVHATEFTNLFNAEKDLFKKGFYMEALLHILKGTREKALPATVHKSSPAPGRDEMLSGRKKRKILIWVSVIIIILLLPMLCCCCCIYLCCCRNSNSDENDSVASDSGGVFSGIFSSIAGCGTTNMIRNFLHLKQYGGTSARVGENNPAEYGFNYRPGGPRDQRNAGNRGFYPSVEVRDEGGGGTW